MLLLLLLFLLLSYLGDQIRKEYFFIIRFEHFWEDQWWVAFVFAAVCAVHGGCTAFAIISKKPIDLFFLPYCWLRFFFFCFSSFHLSPAGGATANGFKCCLVWVSRFRLRDCYPSYANSGLHKNPGLGLQKKDTLEAEIVLKKKKKKKTKWVHCQFLALQLWFFNLVSGPFQEK